jgi:hypothetical protein
VKNTYVFFGLAAALSMSAFACSDDETTTTAGTTTTTGTGGSSTTTTTGTGGSSTTAGTGGHGTGGHGTGGSSAAAFCADYDTTCGFGNADRFADEADCLAYFEGASAGCQGYMTQHLGFASADPAVHCPHACGTGSNACDPVGCN